MDTTKPQVGDKELVGIILSLATFWLCAQTFLNLGPTVGSELGIEAGVMNVIISLSALVCGMFIVMWGAIGDRWGRVRTIHLGNLMAVVGSLLIALAGGPTGLAATMMVLGRILQGMSTAAVMPAALGLVNTYWEGKARSRALSVFSMGTFGGMALSSSFGGVVAGALGWRAIFFIAVAFGVLGMLLLRRVPESAPQRDSAKKLDLGGTALLAIAMVSFQLILTQGANWGWTNPITFAVIAVFLISLVAFVRHELAVEGPLIDFKVFKNRQFSGAVIANFSVTSSAGLITVALWVLQGAGNMSVTQSGYLTLSYAVVLLLFIRVGERLMNKHGRRLPMLVGTSLVVLSILLLAATNTMQQTYVVIAAIAFGIYGLGLALFATPATSAAMGSLPPDQIGVGGGMFKMASSLGSAIGIAISSTVFVTLQTSGTRVIGTFIDYTGRQSNVAVREAGSVALLVLAVLAVVAFVVVWFTASKEKPAH